MASARPALMRRAAALACLTAGACACSDQFSSVSAPPMQTISDFSLSETQNGVIQWTLRAREAILHDAGSAETVDPHVQLYDGGKPSTQFQSKQGVYKDATRNIHMEKDVVITTRDEDSADATVVKTESMDYINAEQKFKTDFPVVVEREGSVMHGRGLIANHDLSEIHILHQETDLK